MRKETAQGDDDHVKIEQILEENVKKCVQFGGAVDSTQIECQVVKIEHISSHFLKECVQF